MKNLPYVEIEFVLTSIKMVTEIVTKRLDIIPSSIRENNQWHKLEGHGLNEINSVPTKEWCLTEREEFCNKIEPSIKKIIMLLEGKEKMLLELKNMYDLQFSLVVIVHSEIMELPEIVLSEEVLAFFAQIGIEISFDFYFY